MLGTYSERLVKTSEGGTAAVAVHVLPVSLFPMTRAADVVLATLALQHVDAIFLEQVSQGLLHSKDTLRKHKQRPSNSFLDESQRTGARVGIVARCCGSAAIFILVFQLSRIAITPCHDISASLLFWSADVDAALIGTDLGDSGTRWQK